MLRWTVAGVIVVGLLVGIWLVWPRDEDDPVSTTQPVAAETTTTTELTTTTTQATTTTTLDPTQVREVETVEQAEAILRELWFGWFEGIYNQDEERIREVVATEELVASAREGFGALEFSERPTFSGIELLDTELLRADTECLAVWSGVRADFRPGASQGLQVLRWVDGRWKLMSVWTHRDDLWETDCESSLQP